MDVANSPFLTTKNVLRLCFFFAGSSVFVDNRKFVFLDMVNLLLFRWIIFHCKFLTALWVLLLFNFLWPCVMAAKIIWELLEIAASNIYFSYCFPLTVRKANVVRSVCAYFSMLRASFFNDLKMHIFCCCIFWLFHWQSVSLSLDPEIAASDYWKLIFHYKIFMKWVCLHPSMEPVTRVK